MAGARGYLLKDVTLDQLRHAIRHLVAAGHSNREIKLGTRDRTRAAPRAISLGPIGGQCSG